MTLDPNDTTSGFVALPSADALTVDEANQTARSSVTRLIVPVGLAGVGKTTLLAELYGKFLQGRFAGYQYVWSRTLHGFEQRSYHARIASGRATPETPRTPLAGPDVFLHLRLAPDDGVAPARDILIADCPGEDFRAMRDDVQVAKSHPFLHRADHIAILVDGKSFGTRALRQEAHHATDILIQSILDAGVDGAVKSVIYTKWDAALKGDGAGQLDEFVMTFEEEIRRKHEDRSGELVFIKTAARPEPDSDLCRGKNLDEVLRLWLRSAREPLEAPVSHRIETVREFGRFRSRPPQGVD